MRVRVRVRVRRVRVKSESQVRAMRGDVRASPRRNVLLGEVVERRDGDVVVGFYSASCRSGRGRLACQTKTT